MIEDDALVPLQLTEFPVRLWFVCSRELFEGQMKTPKA